MLVISAVNSNKMDEANLISQQHYHLAYQKSIIVSSHRLHIIVYVRCVPILHFYH